MREECEIVAVHDAVRPFFTNATFHALLDAAAASGASFPGLPVTDTIHIVDDDSRIVATPQRRMLFAAQTPQCFRTVILRDVLARAAQGGDDATDEAGLAAKYGYPVVLVAGDPTNFKITRPEDLIVAERMYQRWSAE